MRSTIKSTNQIFTSVSLHDTQIPFAMLQIESVDKPLPPKQMSTM